MTNECGCLLGDNNAPIPVAGTCVNGHRICRECKVDGVCAYCQAEIAK